MGTRFTSTTSLVPKGWDRRNPLYTSSVPGWGEGPRVLAPVRTSRCDGRLRLPRGASSGDDRDAGKSRPRGEKAVTPKGWRHQLTREGPDHPATPQGTPRTTVVPTRGTPQAPHGRWASTRRRERSDPAKKGD